METQYLKGTLVAEKINRITQEKLKYLKKKPKLASIVVSGNASVLQYVESQKKACQEMGVLGEIHFLPAFSSEQEILEKISCLNQDPEVTGILLLLPLPKGLEVEKLQQAIEPSKDVEGIHPFNLGKLVYADFSLAPCTAKAVYLLLQSLDISLSGKEIVVISQSRIVGTPLILMLLYSHEFPPTVTCCHKGTCDLSLHTRKADILVVAAGVPGLIRGDMIKPGAILIDVGISEIEEGGEKKITGDVEQKSIWGIARLVTPIVEGVGIITTSVLIENLVTLAERANRLNRD